MCHAGIMSIIILEHDPESGIHVPTSRTFSGWWHNTSSCQYFWYTSGKANLSHAVLDGIHIVTSSNFLTMCSLIPATSWISVSSCGTVQHHWMTCGGMHEPVAARNVSTRGLTLGTMSFPSFTQDQPTEASATCWRAEA